MSSRRVTCSLGLSFIGSPPEDWTREAGRAAVAFRQLLALVDEHLHACRFKAAPRLGVAVHGEADAGSEGQDVRSHRFELFVGTGTISIRRSSRSCASGTGSSGGYATTRSSSSGLRSERRCITSPRPGQWGGTNPTTPTRGRRRRRGGLPSSFGRWARPTGQGGSP